MKSIKIYSVRDIGFTPYGKVIGGYDTNKMLDALTSTTPLNGFSAVQSAY